MDGETAADFLTRSWERCAAAPERRGDPFRTPVLASVHPRLGSQARMVVLRDCDRPARALVFHADGRTGKFEALVHDPRVALLFWDAEQQLQVRVEGEAAVLDAASERGGQALRELSADALSAYAHRPDPGAAIAVADGYDAPREHRAADAERFFRLVRVRADRIDALSLANGTQKRASWTRGGAERWIVP